jgi:hypothetical protein
MGDLTVEDILAARPGLRERAKDAERERRERQQREREDEQRQLYFDTQAFFTETLGCALVETPAWEDCSFRDYSPPGNRKQVCTFTIDGIKFQTRYELKKVMERKSSEFDAETIYENGLVVEVYVTLGWQRVEELADVAKALT